jgi:hypothetical protein
LHIAESWRHRASRLSFRVARAMLGSRDGAFF